MPGYRTGDKDTFRVRGTIAKGSKAPCAGWAAIERSRHRQSSRLVQIREGDACTKFFHQRANGRRKRNLIAYLRTPSYNIVWNHEEKEAILFEFYSELLDTKVELAQVIDWNRLELSTIEDEAMDRPFS